MASDPHPFKLVRQSLEPRMTIRALADEALVAPLIVIRTEQGLFSTPPVGVVVALAARSGVDEALLDRHYSEWVTRHRWAANATLRQTLRPVTFSAKHPMSVWLTAAYGTSNQEWAKRLCVHHSTMDVYTSGKQRFMPGQLMIALAQAGFAHDEINAMDRLGVEFYNVL